jgi:hypothetical protein
MDLLYGSCTQAQDFEAYSCLLLPINPFRAFALVGIGMGDRIYLDDFSVSMMQSTLLLKGDR